MVNESTGSCLPCGLHEPARNNYFPGRFLTDRDMNNALDYHRGHRHLHNSLLHGTGTVCGLKLIEHPAENCRREFLVLEPGMGLDCCGREIVVPERALFPVAQLLAADPDLAAALDGTRHLVIGLQACDQGIEPVPAILPGCSGEIQDMDFNRIAERYRPVLHAVHPADLVADESPEVAKLSWVHTITLDAQLPRALHANEAENWLQLGTDAVAGGSHLYLHGEPTGDLLALLEGPAQLTDTASIREARLVLAAGSGFTGQPEGTAGGIGFWPATTVAEDTTRSGLLALEAPLVRLAVSPGSGVLCALELLGDAARLSSWAPNQLLDWLTTGGDPAAAPAPIGVLEFDHGFGDDSSAAARGAGMLRFSHDGRFLALAAPAASDEQRCYVVDVSELNGGTLTQAQALATGIAAGTNAVGLDWSLDDAFLYVLDAGQLAAEPAMELHRYARIGQGTGMEQRGHGVRLAGTARDLRIAPTETRAYLLLADPAGITRLTTVDLERVKTVEPAEPEQVQLSADAVRIDGDGRSLELTGHGSRLYLAAADADSEAPPARGLIAVIEIQENDCSIHLERQLDSCPGCQGAAAGCGCTPASPDLDISVILGHIANYVAAEQPVMVDADGAQPGEAVIDNLSYRTLVPSAATLREIINCMLRRGIDVGPPGPRGDPGSDGTDGADGADGADGVDGTDGADGLGIDNATVEYREELTEPTVEIVISEGKRILDIDLPAPETGNAVAANPIIATSWVHAQTYEPRLGHFGEDMHEFGIAVAFERPVDTIALVREARLKRNTIAYLQRRVFLEGGTYVWANIQRVDPVPLAPDPEIQDALVVKWSLDPDSELSPGFALLANDVGFEDGELLRVEFYADFLLDEAGRAVAGALLGETLPTGGGGPGGTFRSWFTVPRDEG